VAAAVSPGLGQVELAIAIGIAADIGRGWADIRVCDRDARQGHVTGVRNHEGVRHHLARMVDQGRRTGFFNIQAGIGEKVAEINRADRWVIGIEGHVPVDGVTG